MNKEGHLWAVMGGVETLPGRKGRELSVPYRRILQGDDHGRGRERRKAAHKGKKHIPAPKAVVLYDGKKKRDPTSQ